ncbi:hypothetical protein [Microvirga zambiensis]|uniref:hypothetical protein n=1 Tax=Microvirga zambiensis TaxID=1402137 RepID=UPI00191FECF2|nr:hypothetical protein [Microvirga zambiensis]
MTTEIHEGPLPAQPREAPAKLSWREKRYRRRRRRVWFEEVLAWVLVPVIVIGCYWLLDVGLNFMGTSPGALLEGLEAVIASL